MNKSGKVIAMASDHGGYEMKEYLIKKLASIGYEIKDLALFQKIVLIIRILFILWLMLLMREHIKPGSFCVAVEMVLK